MRRPWQTWALFGVSLALVVAVMAWVTTTVLRLDDEAAQMRGQAAFEEDIRLALWRMDAMVSPIIGIENARPIHAYHAYTGTDSDGALIRAGRISPGDTLVPSPMLVETPALIKLHFELEPNHELSSPQVPLGELGRFASQHYLTGAQLVRNQTLLEQLDDQIIWDDFAMLPSTVPVIPVMPVPAPARSAQAKEPPQPQPAPAQVQAKAPAQRDRLNLETQQALNLAEYAARNTSMANVISRSKGAPSQAAVPLAEALDRESDAADGGTVPEAWLTRVGSVLSPLWVEDELLLARRVATEDGELVQGCWLDWQLLRHELTTGIADLLPGASLTAISEEDQQVYTTVGRRLASLPVLLQPGPVPVTGNGGLSPLRISLIVAWSCLLLAALAVFTLLLGAVSLSERRGAFVSAVTHELRTPLTSLRIYTEMLADGLVVEEKRQDYLETLRGQSERLAHLVENVLAYSRLERGRRGGTLEAITIHDLLDRVSGPLIERCRQAETSLLINIAESTGASRVRVDLSAVERILMNLVDNAAKYGGPTGSTESSIELQVYLRDSSVWLRVHDHGPGLSPQARARLFRPFSRSAAEAAGSAPGIGLGLALSHRLARRMGGELRLDETSRQGTAFVLRLPVTA